MENKHPSSSPAGERENIMGTMDINPLLIKLSVPMMVSMLVQALYNVVDSIFVSHVSESALTAVSLAFSLQNVRNGPIRPPRTASSCPCAATPSSSSSASPA